MRIQIRFTSALPVWVFIGSAYFIVITEISEKRDIFTYYPGGDESGFLEKEAGARERKTCHDRKWLPGVRVFVCACLCFPKNKRNGNPKLWKDK